MYDDDAVSQAEKQDDTNHFSIMEAWETQYNRIEEAERITFKPISKLSESEVNDLYNKLKEKGFIAPDTEVERLKHILSGDKYDGDKPIVWIKRQTRNQKPSRASVIDFLYLLG